MDQKRHTAAEALDVFDAVMSSLRSDDRPLLSAQERVILMQRARRFSDRAASLACVLTDEANLGSQAATGTPLDRFKATRATGASPRIVEEQVSDDNLRTPDQRRADALAQLVADHRDAPRSVGDRPRIVVTIREADLRDKAERAGVLATGAKIAAGDLRRLCCDADLMPAVLGSHSEILDVGRTQRLVTPAIRKALTMRDGSCILPGCAASDSRCEAHHISAWWKGGATALSNLVLLCGHHHALVEPSRHPKPHERPDEKWVIHIDRDTGQPVLTPPGRTIRFMDRGEVNRCPLASVQGGSLAMGASTESCPAPEDPPALALSG